MRFTPLGLLMTLTLTLLGAGCGDATENPSSVGASTDTSTDDTLDSGDTGPSRDPDTGSELPVPERIGRKATRMTVQQLVASIPVVTDGIHWEEDFGDGPVDMIQVLAPTLGQPDYLLVTEENLEPSMIIAKFVSDAANRICVRWVARDRSLPPAERSLVRIEEWTSLDEAAVKSNLRRLQLRFFTRYVPEDDEEVISDLYDLFLMASTGAIQGNEASDGWLAVCIAMMTDPEFVLY